VDTTGRPSRIESSAPTPDTTTGGREDYARSDNEAAQSQAAVREHASGGLSRAAEAPNFQPIQGGEGAASSALNEAREPVPARDHRPLPELPAQNETEIIREARILARNGGGQAHIQLHPPQLGELTLQVNVTDRAVTVSLIAEHAQIADLLARHLPELRQALEGAGIRMEELDVEARSAADDRDQLESRGSADNGEARDYGASRRSGLLGTDLPEVRPLPLVSLNSLGTVDVTI
jgi:flagellar hook-length control protein FliK